jgi:hypothetical protein
MNPAAFSLRSISPTMNKSRGTPKVFRISAAAELARRGCRPRTGSDILAVRMLPRSDSLAAQAALAKIANSLETCRVHFNAT